ncbi:MAG TPA: class I SAM-dependent methyltransferase [Candidatus Eisenbacteria bacterium]|nr:class I SAM-dependent methyltransferase [Candidatus Eisenbacteria bacterium]
MTFAPCVVCGGREARFLFKGEDRLYFLKGSFDLYRCAGCGLVFVHPPLDESGLAGYYPGDYYSYADSEKVSSGPPAPKKSYLFRPFAALNALFYSKILRQNADLPADRGSRVLDIGCGDGRYLLEKRKSGAVCFGVDIGAEGLHRLNRRDPEITTFCGNVWDAKLPADYFDVVNLCHVLEHVVEAGRLADEIRRVLKPSGRLRAQVPNFASLTAKLFGPHWMGLDVPRHVRVFSRKNLRNFFASHGFEVVSSRTIENSFGVIGSSVYLGNTLFKKRRRLMEMASFWDNEIVKALFIPYALLVQGFGIGDSVEFILKKKGDGK